MPHYDYECSNDACPFAAYDVQLPIAERDYPTTQACPKCGSAIVKLIQAPGISYQGIKTTRQRTPDTFKDILRNIKKNHRGSTIDV